MGKERQTNEHTLFIAAYFKLTQIYFADLFSQTHLSAGIELPRMMLEIRCLINLDLHHLKI